eukprot:Selendium_serpulae@DN5747_c0_g1_i14.p2
MEQLNRNRGGVALHRFEHEYNRVQGDKWMHQATTKQNPSSRYPMSPQYLCCYRYGFLQVGLPMTDLFSGTKIGSLILQFWQTNGMICSLPRTACLNNKRFDFKKKKKKKKKKYSALIPT